MNNSGGTVGNEGFQTYWRVDVANAAASNR